MIAWKAHNLRLLTEAAQGVDSGVKRMIVKYGGTMLGFRLASLAIDALGTAGLPFESAGEDAEDDDATTWNIDYMYDVGLMIGGGSNNIQKNIIVGTRPRSAARAEGREGLMEFALSEEQRLFADSLRGLLADRMSIEALRRHAEAGSGFDAALWDSLVELGLPGFAGAGALRRRRAWHSGCRGGGGSAGRCGSLRTVRWQRRDGDARIRAWRIGGTAGCLAAAHCRRRSAVRCRL